MPKAQTRSAVAAARMIAVKVPRRAAHPPLLVAAADSLAATIDAVRAAADLPDEPCRLTTVVDGIAVEPTESVWSILLAKDSALRVFELMPGGEPGGLDDVKPIVAAPSAASATATLNIFVRTLTGKILEISQCRTRRESDKPSDRGARESQPSQGADPGQGRHPVRRLPLWLTLRSADPVSKFCCTASLVRHSN